jgi:Flp pilus assembly protein protease CpaA
MVQPEIISLATALIGTGIAAVWDLKTTEVPDQIPFAMIGIAIILFSYQSIVEWSYKPILNSLIVGLSFLAFGVFMYYVGQWGGADSALLAAVGFLLPTSTVQTIFPFPITFITNLFLIGAAYMIIYGIVFAIMNKKILVEFKREMISSSNILLFGSIGLFVLFILANYIITKSFSYVTNISFILIDSLIPLGLSLLLFTLWKFTRSIEEHGFKKRIPVSKLKIGDMLLKEKKLIGITEQQLKKIKKSGVRYVEIKDGVRFAPAFILTIIFTFIFGDAILIFIKFLS